MDCPPARDSPAYRATVVVPVRNARGIVTEQLEALLAEARSNGLEVIVVADASSDGTPGVVTEWIARRSSGEFRLIERRRRGGPNAARNDGAAAATTDFLLFCDGDDVVVDGWAAAILAARADDVILGGALATFTSSGTELDVGTFPLPGRSWGIPYAYGGNMAMTRAVFERVGGFDEEILAGGTEVDFCVRAARNCAIPVVPVPGAVIRYRLPTTGLGDFALVFKRERGHCYLRKKFGAGVVPGQSVGSQARDVVRLAWHAVRGVWDMASRMQAARLAGKFTGRAWWSIRLRVPFRSGPHDGD
jgi:glycosyltransferase involved in cell wall biosynthesis